MKELIKSTFNLWIKRRWLKSIERDVDKYNRLDRKLKTQAFIVHSMIKRYHEIYGEELLVKERSSNESISM